MNVYGTFVHTFTQKFDNMNTRKTLPSLINLDLCSDMQHILKWPSQSPGLSLIEHLWHVVEQEIRSDKSAVTVFLSCQYELKSLRNFSSMMMSLCHKELQCFEGKRVSNPLPNEVAVECVYCCNGVS